ncbi:MAG: phosphohydrolase, partial [Desulfobacterales bacterium]
FEQYLSDIRQKNKSSVIFSQFLNGMSASYTEIHKSAEIVRDFIAGMTDAYFLNQCPADMRPSIQRL